MSYLRFTPEEFRSIRLACGSIHLSDGFFTFFRYFLVESLGDSSPGLAQRLRQVSAPKLRILYKFLRDKERKTSRAGSHGQSREQHDDAWGGLSIREWHAVRQESGPFFLYDGTLRSFQDYLIFAFRETTPGLAKKLARFSRSQIARLYQKVKERGDRWD